MKQILLASILSLAGLAASAQTVYVCKDGDYTATKLAEGLQLDLTELPDSITFSRPAITPVVTIVYNGTTASVSIPNSMKDAITCSSGTSSMVEIVNTDTLTEVAYNVSGSSSAGSLVIKGDYKMTVNLNNLSLTSPKGEAMRFKCGKRIALVMAEGSTNTFADMAEEDTTHHACIYTKGHFEISGAGTLNVTGNHNHGIACKEYMLVKRTTKAINILSAANDGIHVGEHYKQNGGIVTLSNTIVGDGVQVEYKTDSLGVIDPDEENTGAVELYGGTLDVTLATTQDVKCVKADGNVIIDGATLVLNANARGSRAIQSDGDVTIAQSEDNTTSLTLAATAGKCTLEEHEDDPDKSMGINADGNINITGGTINITASGASANGMKADGNLAIGGGTTTIYATGSSSNGMKIVGDVVITGGTVIVANTGKNSKGIVYSGTYTKSGGTVTASMTQK